MRNRITDVEIEIEGVALSVGVEIYAPRKESPDGWWRETSVTLVDEKADIYPLLQHFSSMPHWQALDGMLDKAEEAIIEQEEMVHG